MHCTPQCCERRRQYSRYVPYSDTFVERSVFTLTQLWYLMAPFSAIKIFSDGSAEHLEQTCSTMDLLCAVSSG